MKIFLIKIILITGSLFSLNSYSISRITGDTDKKMRCVDTPLPIEDCNDRRTQALQIGCITQEEFNDLVRFGSAPACNTLKKVTSPIQYLEGWCACGCFASFTKIDIIDRENTPHYLNNITLAKAKTITENSKNFDLVHLAEEATLDNILITSSPIRISTEGMENKELVKIETTDHRKLYVTTKHPILTSKGTMVMATNLRPSDQLINRYGETVEIKSLSTIPYKGQVYNFMSEINSKNGHVIFAEGLAVGDLYWQSSLEDQLNQEFIRR